MKRYKDTALYKDSMLSCMEDLVGLMKELAKLGRAEAAHSQLPFHLSHRQNQKRVLTFQSLH